MDFTIYLNDQDNVQAICINNRSVSALKLLKGVFRSRWEWITS